MFDDPRDLNRDLRNRDPYSNLPGEGSGYALPLALLAVVVVVGGLIAFAPATNQQTATNTPAVERTAPPPMAPAPPKQ